MLPTHRCGVIAVSLIALMASAHLSAQSLSVPANEEALNNSVDIPSPAITDGSSVDFTGQIFAGTSSNPTGGLNDVFAVDPATNMSTNAFSGNVWGATADSANGRILFTTSAGSTNGDQLWEVPITGGAPIALGTIRDAAGAPVRIDGLALSGGVLYGSVAGATAADGLWSIDMGTLVATQLAAWGDSISGIDADPATGIIYGVNDSLGQVQTIDTDGTRNNLVAYPAGYGDIDGIAAGNGFLYLVTDEAQDIQVYDLAGGAFVAPLTSPFGTPNTFSGAAFAGAGGGTGPARFRVSKNFDDDNPSEVDVVIQCNTGLPLMQPASIAEGDPVTFVVGDFEDGTMTCEVTENVPAGYTASYDNGDSVSATSCVFEAVGLGSFNTCDITNTLNEVDVEVTKVWIDENPQFNPVNYAEAVWSCSNVAFECEEGLGGNDCDFGNLAFLGNPGSDGFSVFPSWDGGTTCQISEVSESDGNVEIDDSECASITLFPGAGGACTIYNTRLYAGIPTLSQYSLAVLAMLMLGVGLVGFRRFV